MEAPARMQLPKLTMFVHGPSGFRFSTYDDPRQGIIEKLAEEVPDIFACAMPTIPPGEYGYLCVYVGEDGPLPPVIVITGTLEQCQRQWECWWEDRDPDDEYDTQWQHFVVDSDGQPVPPPADWQI
jgi:hypothetical protein